MTTTETLTYPVWQKVETLGVETVEAVEAVVDINSGTDFALAQSATKGNMAAFEELYNRHHRRVYSLCLRKCIKTWLTVIR